MAFPNNYDFISVAKAQRLRMYINGLCVVLLSLKFIQTFRINKYISWTFAAIGNSMISMCMVYFLLTPFLISMSFYNYYLCGDLVFEVNNL